MIESGVYKSGSNAMVDRAISARDDLGAFLRQSRHDHAGFDDAIHQLSGIVTKVAAHA
jgi:flagellar biosynthesis/type III secretory pathway ATPase